MKNKFPQKTFLYWNRHIFSKSIEYFNKKTFCWNFYFHGKFFWEKLGKILTKQFFSTNLFKLGKTKLCQVVEGTLLRQEIFFWLATWKSFLENYEQKFRKFSNFSIIFLHQIRHISRTTLPTPLIFFTRNTILYLLHFDVNWTFLSFVVLKL